MKDEKNSETSGVDANHTRRRLTKAALSLPVITSLAPRVAFGIGPCSISGFLSGNVSPSQTIPYNCTSGTGGCTPGFWKNNITAWPAVVSPGTCTEFKANGKCKTWDSTVATGNATAISALAPPACSGEFSTFLSGAGYTDTDSILEVLLRLEGLGFMNSILAHFIAAIFNSLSSPTVYGSSVQDIQDGWCKAYAEGKLEEYKDILDTLNNRGCFLNAHGECNTGFVLYQGACIPTTECSSINPSTGECESLNSTP
jgi:hypothetical protein